MLNVFNYILAAVENPGGSIPIEIRQNVIMAFTVLMVLASIAMIVVVMMQKGTNDNVGVIAGASDTYYGRNKKKGKEAILKKITLGIFVFIMVCAIIAVTVWLVK